ncbi:BOP1NT-domain-containing protein [Fistulina hepatica ATCC 64428]|nr:BOP1NT-domain-containing protein [Fistulina hepatica ATCC 64428]
MAVFDKDQISKKRKHDSETVDEPFKNDMRIEMLSDDEGGASISSDDGEAEDFPVINAESDSEHDEFDDEEEDEEKDDTEDQEDDDSEDDGSDASSVHVFPKPKTIISDVTGWPKRVYPEIEPDYDSDSSTEDASYAASRMALVGNVPMHWYDDLPHVGYDINGKKILRPARGDELDKFLQTVDDSSAWTSAFDKNMQMDKPLTAEELDIIRRLHANEVPDAEYNPYEPMTEWFTGKGKEEVMPLSAAPEPKRRWIPSKWEKQKVMKIVRAIRQGRILPSKPKTASTLGFYSIWSEPSQSHTPPLPAPKPRLPTNSESYNPPEEYLPTDAERTEWEAMDPEDRETDYLPRRYSSLRLVPAYDQFVKERFNRQLDLYLAPRIQRVRLNIDPNSLIPKLPSPSSLKPFPCYRSLKVAHKKRVRCISVSPDGLWVISGDESGFVGLWEVNVGRIVKTWQFDGKIGAVEWCPRTDVAYFVVSTDQTLHFIVPPSVPGPIYSATQSLLAPAMLPPPPAVPSPVKWSSVVANSWSEDKPVHTVRLPQGSGLPKQIAWHRRGDYLATVSDGNQGGIWIHQITRRHSQAPFKKIRGTVQVVQFHPLKPYFFVATQQYVRVYNLAEQKLVKTLMPGIRWISCLDVHPSGDHLIVGGYDRKLCWFDLELSDKPYKVFRYHTKALRAVQFHPTYPLFASSSDDGAIQIFHARVFNDLMTDPLIVPLKILRGHDIAEGLGVLQLRWCHRQPWLVSAGADGAVGVWCS